jgi:ferredoxin
MQPHVYYFTGTGNSLAVARCIAAGIDGRLVPVAAAVRSESPPAPAEVVGFVFPIYDFKPASIVIRLIERLGDLSGAYVFAVGTYGLVPGNAMGELADAVAERGGALSGGFALRMPHNGLGGVALSEDRQQILYDRAIERCDAVAAYVTRRDQGTLERLGIFRGLVLTGRAVGVLPRALPILYSAATEGWHSLDLFADERCDGCGVCARACPVENVTMRERTPVWGDECVLCFACLQWCPKTAVQAGKVTQRMGRVHHPAVRLADIVRQKQLAPE